MNNGESPDASTPSRDAGRLLLASSFPVLALALQWLLWEAIMPYVWVFFYPAVFFSSWVGGKLAGLLATAFSALAVWFIFMSPMQSPALERSASTLALAIFSAMGVLFSLFHERLREANRRASSALAEVLSAKEHLEERICDRTEELQRIVNELRRKEADLRKAQELAKLGSWSYEANGSLQWSEQLYSIYGMAPGEEAPDIEGFLQIIHPEDRSAMQGWIDACMAGESPGELEFRVVLPDGSLRFISGRGELVRDGNGSALRMSGTGQDITDRVEAESARRESEERLRLFIEHAPVPLAMFDSEMRYIFASLCWRRDYQLGDDNVTGKSHYEVFPEIPEQWKELHRRAMAGETLRAEADPFVRGNGSVQWIRWEIRPWYGERGEVGGILIFSEDVTERKLAEEKLRQSEDRFRTMVDAMPQLAWVAQADGQINWYNRRWYEYTGMTPEQAERQEWQSFHDPQVLPAALDQWQASIATGTPFEMVLPLKGADGEFRPFLTRVLPLKDPHGKVVQWLGTNTDVTEIKRAEDALQRMNDELEQRVAQRTEALDELLVKQEAQNVELQEAYHELEVESAERIRMLTELRKKDQVLIHQSRLAAMGEMLGYIAHQWRQPLNVLGLNLQVLGLSYKHGSFSRELLEESVAKAMGIIKHLSRTIDDFRDFLVLNKEKTTFRVDDVIEKTVGLIRENLEKERISISICSTGEPRISGYPNEYGHVILNLLTNAKDAFAENQVPEPQVTLRAWVEGGQTLVTVTDNAGGIKEEIMDKIFDAYFTTKELGKGSGVGLFMSKMIIEKNMGGRLTVRNLDGGAEFRIEVANRAAG